MTSNQKTFSIAASREMSPTAKLIVYFMKNAEVVSDTLNFYVEDTRLMSVSITILTLRKRQRRMRIMRREK